MKNLIKQNKNTDNINVFCRIYKYTNLINKKIYIGQTWIDLKKRAGSNGVAYKGCHKFYMAIKKYGWSNFSGEVLLTCNNQKIADCLERLFIKFYNSCDRKIGYNLKDGGSNGKHSEETKIKMSKIKLNLSDEARHNMSLAHIGHFPSEETKKKRSLSMMGHPVSKETRKKLSKSQKGRVIPFETREKISKTLIGRKNSAKRKLTDEQIYFILNSFDSGVQLAKLFNVHRMTISRIKTGKLKPLMEK